MKEKCILHELDFLKLLYRISKAFVEKAIQHLSCESRETFGGSHYVLDLRKQHASISHLGIQA